MSKSKKLSSAQANALYYIELDGGLMRTINEEHPFTTKRGRAINAVTAQWLIDHEHLLAHSDGLLGDVCQSWEVKNKLGVERREDAA